MSRSAAVTFKGTPLTLAGEAVAVGAPGPDFSLTYFEDGFQSLTNECLKGKPAIISVVPSLDTGVCQIQTKKFSEELSALGDQVNAVTVSVDLPFAQGRFCGDEGISNMQTASDYMDGNFGAAWGMMIEELQLLARGVFVVDGAGVVTYAETVSEVTDEPNYEAAMSALKALV